MKIDKEMISNNLPFSLKMAWKFLPEDQKDQIVERINSELAKASDDAAIDALIDKLESQFPAIGPAKGALKEMIKKAK